MRDTSKKQPVIRVHMVEKSAGSDKKSKWTEVTVAFKTSNPKFCRLMPSKAFDALMATGNYDVILELL